MLRLARLIFFFAIFFSLSGALSPARAGVDQLSEPEFIALSEKLSQKVNLFRTAWAQDPNAQFYGGTTRDFLYWVKGKFKSAHTRAEAEAVREELLKLNAIDVRDFIIGESDVDIISEGLSLKAEDFGVKNIDSHGPDIFNPGTELGKTEVNQGFIPAEKIRLSQRGFEIDHFGNGAREIYTGKLTLHAPDPDKFAATKYALEKINHPVLLALRFLRLQAMNHFNEVGRGFPDKTKLFDLDPASEKFVRDTIRSVTERPELTPYFAKERFGRLLNGVIQKMFRSYTSPTAAMELSKKFGVDKLPSMYEQVQPINQYLFARYDDPAAVKANLDRYRISPDRLYQPIETFFPDRLLYHGTRKDADFAAILRQGILPSEGGAAGDGLYGVNEANKDFSERWGGDKNRLVKFEIAPDAKIVDITTDPGLKLFRAFGKSETEFAEAFGIDILRYDYGDQLAFVVKNSEILKRPKGVYREVLTLSRAISLAEEVGNDPAKIKLLSDSMNLSGFNAEESALVADAWLKNYPNLFELPAKEYFRHMSESVAGKGIFSQSIFDRAVINYANRNLKGETNVVKITEFIRAADDFSANAITPPSELYPIIQEWKAIGAFAAEAKALAATPYADLMFQLQHFGANKVGSLVKHAFFIDRARLEVDRILARKQKGQPTGAETFLQEHLGYGFWNHDGLPRKAYEDFAEETADRFESRGLLDKLNVDMKRDLNYPAPGTDALHVSLMLRKLADRFSKLNRFQDFPDVKMRAQLHRARRHPYFPIMRSRVMEAWRTNGMIRDFGQFNSMAELELKLYVLVQAEDEGFPILADMGPEVLKNVKQTYARGPLGARQYFLEFLKAPLSTKSAQHTRNVALALLLETDAPVPDLLIAVNKVARTTTGLPRGHFKVIDEWIERDFTKLDPEFALEILRACDHENLVCQHLLKKNKIWNAAYSDPRLAKEAWKMAFEKFWPHSMLGQDFVQHPIPAEFLERFRAEGADFWRKRGKISYLEADEAGDKYFYFQEFAIKQVMDGDEFFKHPEAVSFIRGGIDHHKKYYDFLPVVKKLVKFNPLAASAFFDEMATLDFPIWAFEEISLDPDWSTHPLMKSWLKAATAYQRNLNESLEQKPYPKRVKSLAFAKKLFPHLDRDIAAWAEAVKKGEVYRPRNSCMGYFRKFFGR